MIHRDRAYLEHIKECVRRIEENTRDDRETFLASYTLQDAVLRNLQTLSEATQRLSITLKEAHPEIEWEQIGAFRNVLVHNYLGIDIEQIWQIVKRDIPSLKVVISAILIDSV
jgi:uncharacterized protein with HEPN domain